MQNETQLISLFATSSLIITLILILVILFVVAYQKRLATQRIKLQVIKQEQQQNLLKATVEVQERERKRIASDLHDDIGSLLSAFMIKVGHLEMNEKDETQQKFLAETKRQLEGGIERVRRISYDMFPPALERYGLWQALDELFSDINQTDGIKATIKIEGEAIALSGPRELAIYRVTQELISNTIKHGNANTIDLVISKNDVSIMITYTDNGRGIADETKMKGLGFLNMLSRIQTLNGEVNFLTSEGKGFVAKFTFPISI
jgi:two-component system NarL family sensor kinase